MWPEYAIIPFRSYGFGYAQSAAASSDGTGPSVQRSRRQFAVKRREFAFTVTEDRIGDFLTWLEETGGSPFPFRDPEIGEDAQVRLPMGRQAVSIEGTNLRSPPGMRVFDGRATLESHAPLRPYSGEEDWPYDSAVPELTGWQWTMPQDEFHRTRMEDGAIRQGVAARPTSRYSADFAFDIPQTSMAALVEWIETVDDRAFTLTFPDGVERLVKLSGGVAGASFRGAGRGTPARDDAPEDDEGFFWRGSIAVVGA